MAWLILHEDGVLNVKFMNYGRISTLAMKYIITITEAAMERSKYFIDFAILRTILRLKAYLLASPSISHYSYQYLLLL